MKELIKTWSTATTNIFMSGDENGKKNPVYVLTSIITPQSILPSFPAAGAHEKPRHKGNQKKDLQASG